MIGRLDNVHTKNNLPPPPYSLLFLVGPEEILAQLTMVPLIIPCRPLLRQMATQASLLWPNAQATIFVMAQSNKRFGINLFQSYTQLIPLIVHATEFSNRTNKRSLIVQGNNPSLARHIATDPGIRGAITSFRVVLSSGLGVGKVVGGVSLPSAIKAQKPSAPLGSLAERERLVFPLWQIAERLTPPSRAQIASPRSRDWRCHHLIPCRAF